jgi:DNA-binding transcriptional LysR family regulator
MDKLTCMRAFVAVVEANGFTSAAHSCGIAKALLSKYVAHLETQLDTRLLQRSTRHVSPTEAGRIYYQRCVPLLEELDELESTMLDTQAKPSGELRLSAPTSFAELHLMKVVADFSRLYPDIRMRMKLTDRKIDIIEEGFDLALRIGHLPDSSLIARRLGSIPIVAYASPAYLERYGEPRTPGQLKQHRCIVDSNFKQDTNWSFTLNRKTTSVAIRSSHTVNSAIAVRELALEHYGITISPLFIIDSEVKAGNLKLILSDYEIETYGLYAMYSHRRQLPLKVRLFIDLLVDYFATITE